MNTELEIKKAIEEVITAFLTACKPIIGFLFLPIFIWTFLVVIFLHTIDEGCNAAKYFIDKHL